MKKGDDNMYKTIEKKLKYILYHAFESTFNKEKFLMENMDYTYFYHLSPIRKNVVNWIPFKKDDTVLEIGSECGILSEYLLDVECNLTCYETNLEKKEILKERLLQYTNVDYVDNDITCLSSNEMYEYILLIGVFERWSMYFNDSIECVLIKLLAKLKPNGKLIIATENKMGIRYLTGATYEMDGIDYKLNQRNQASLFSKQELELLMKEIGEVEYQFYYPYPDYRFITEIYSDEHLPKLGDLYGSSPRYSPQNCQLEEDALRNLFIEEGMIERFFNSYIIEVTCHE